MKAIIPVAGAGAKLRPHTYTQPKALIPIAGKTILSFIVDQLKAEGINEFIFVVGYLGEKIQDYVEQTYPNLKTHFVYQNDRQGTAHAIQLAQDIVGGDEVFIALGDTICEYDIKEVLESPTSMLGVQKVDDPRQFGVAEMNEDGMIEHVVEKPSIPKSNHALVGLYKIKDSTILFDCFQKLVKDNIDATKYHLLSTKEDRISYLRALAIGSLINDAVAVFIENEAAILKGNFPHALMDKSKYKAQMDDIIKLSVKNIYNSREVIEKEIVGYQIIQTLLDKFITAFNNKYNGTCSNYDHLVLKMLPEKFHVEKQNLYDRLLHICNYISLLTDGNALELYEMFNGKKKM